MSNSRQLSARDALANIVVQPNANFQDAAQGLAAAFLAGRKTPEEVQLEAAKNSLAQQTLLDETHKNQDYMLKQQAFQDLQNQYNKVGTSAQPTAVPTDGSIGPVIPTPIRNSHDIFASPEGARALTAAATNMLKSGVKPGDINDINRTFASYQANVPSSGMTDDMLMRLAGSPAIGVNDAVSLQGQTDIANRNAALDVYKTQAAKVPNLKEQVTNTVIQKTLSGQPITAQERDAYRVANPLSGEAGPRASMAQNGMEQLAEAKNLLTDPKTGKFNLNTIASATTDIPGMGAGLPFSQGRQARNALSNAVEAQLRLETGAAVNAGELPRIIDRLLPSLFDNEATKAQKLNNLDRLLSGTLEFIDPTNPYLARDKVHGGVVDLSGGPTKTTPYGTTSPSLAPTPVVNPAAVAPSSVRIASEPVGAFDTPEMAQQRALRQGAAPTAAGSNGWSFTPVGGQ